MSTEALVVAVISRDRSVHQLIASALEETPGADCPLWTLAEYPAPDQMAEIGRASVGCVVFLDFDDVQRAKAVAAELDLNYPRATTVAIHSANRLLDLNELMRLGIREVIELPASAGEVARFLARARRKLEQAASTAENGGGRICAFLPAKPGSGATTIALHSAAAAARLANRRTLLIDLDLQLGMTSFLLKLHGSHSVMDALLFKDQLESVWDRLICRRELLEVLGSASGFRARNTRRLRGVPARFRQTALPDGVRRFAWRNASARIRYAPSSQRDFPGLYGRHWHSAFGQAEEGHPGTAWGAAEGVGGVKPCPDTRHCFRQPDREHFGTSGAVHAGRGRKGNRRSNPKG